MAKKKTFKEILAKLDQINGIYARDEKHNAVDFEGAYELQEQVVAELSQAGLGSAFFCSLFRSGIIEIVIFNENRTQYILSEVETVVFDEGTIALGAKYHGGSDSKETQAWAHAKTPRRMPRKKRAKVDPFKKGKK